MNFGDHCTFCGVKHLNDADWPRTCSNGHTMYSIVTTVAVVLLPIITEDTFRLFGVRRNIPPIGKIALPGGYVDGRNKRRPVGETWQQACVRELYEESSGCVDVQASEVQEFMVRSTETDLCLVFGIVEKRSRDWFDRVKEKFTPNKETQELVLIDGATDLAFFFHTEAANRWFRSVEYIIMQMKTLR